MLRSTDNSNYTRVKFNIRNIRDKSTILLFPLSNEFSKFVEYTLWT